MTTETLTQRRIQFEVFAKVDGAGDCAGDQLFYCLRTDRNREQYTYMYMYTITYRIAQRNTFR